MAQQIGFEPRLQQQRLYHITAISNLESIAARRGLDSLRNLEARGVAFASSAYPNLRAFRFSAPVACGAGGTLQDHVPFYFIPKPPMLRAIADGRIRGQRQESIAYLVTTIGRVLATGRAFAFTDGHSRSPETRMSCALEDLGGAIRRDGAGPGSSGGRELKRRQQAEFLVRDRVDLALISEVVMTRTAKREAESSLHAAGATRPRVLADPAWYY